MNLVSSLNSQTWKKGPKSGLVRVKGPVKPFQERKVNLFTWDLRTSKLSHYSQV